MVCTFGLRHLLLVWRLQRQGAHLDLQQSMLHPSTPLVKALTGHWSLAEGPTCTFVLSSSESSAGHDGFVQARLRPSGREADVEYIAPSAGDPAWRSQLWSALLVGMCQGLGRHGVERVFARLTDDFEDAGTFQQVGFVLYTREDVFRLPALAERAPEGRLRPATASDAWGIDRLYSVVTPRSVQAAEGFGSSSSAQAAPRMLPGAHHVYVSDFEGEIRSCVELVPSVHGHWMRVMIHPAGGPNPLELLDEALSVLGRFGPRPVHCVVRAYQGGLREALQDQGFRFLTSQAMWVKTMAVRVAEPVGLARVLQRRAELHTPTTMIQSPLPEDHGERVVT